MLSYQHAYHAGNLADLHKHALLAAAMDYMTAKDKPLTYLETHSGRGLYRLSAPESLKTGEAAAGITRAMAEHWLATDHPLMRALSAIRTSRGADVYPGSPLIAAHFLRPDDRAHLAELHPAEHQALMQVAGFATVHHRDGFDMAQAVCPPTPRRGLLLIDPSYEVKADYATIPKQIGQIARKWNVGVIALWYPILTDNRHEPMLAALSDHDALRSEVCFAPARPGHAMVGSGMWILNAPYGLAEQAANIEKTFRDHAGDSPARASGL
ncbi:23S rRNA (adenine(2030)-N(6))-methyltransferase RlmJ [Paracoccus sp. (in: a-proteobacteria)]|uniref:23S rRNA (adenine(2030)-N(6))-methyltransferase RlmJ n=1 Tax=Paracoccus sp. TaxID=267 RepID=UPI0026DF0EB5|nr:23S rRNA (adenine(2030)-N(6))-methyltransferase RlmJ [Paracoccus sp. (in: a-proteobacteria)]MDO5647924.1 23S rRNA (adenine(2030)-N(6))-methyltransferase RlmJ [Paracoccus sp. (in: a-proteobacteria)]